MVAISVAKNVFSPGSSLQSARIPMPIERANTDNTLKGGRIEVDGHHIDVPDFDVGKQITLQSWLDHMPKEYFEVPELSTDPLENIPQEYFEFDVEKYMDANFDKNKYLQGVMDSIPEEYFAVPWDAVKPPDPYAEPDL